MFNFINDNQNSVLTKLHIPLFYKNFAKTDVYF